METGQRVLRPITDKDARLYIGAAYAKDNDKDLTLFFESIDESLSLLDKRRRHHVQP
jgi:hypothetical protein